MKNSKNNLTEEIKRMKSLFTEERLYGNLVEQDSVDNTGKSNKETSAGDETEDLSIDNKRDYKKVVRQTKKLQKQKEKEDKKEGKKDDKDNFRLCKLRISTLKKLLIDTNGKVEDIKEKHPMDIKAFNYCMEGKFGDEVKNEIIKHFGKDVLKKIKEKLNPQSDSTQGGGGKSTIKDQTWTIKDGSRDYGTLEKKGDEYIFKSNYRLGFMGDKQGHTHIWTKLGNPKSKVPTEVIDILKKTNTNRKVKVRNFGKKLIFKTS